MSKIFMYIEIQEDNKGELTMSDPGIAAVLSFFTTGLGQIYNGQILKGLILMILQSINVLLCFILIGFVTLPLLWIYGIYDAYQVAKNQP